MYAMASIPYFTLFHFGRGFFASPLNRYSEDFGFQGGWSVSYVVTRIKSQCWDCSLSGRQLSSREKVIVCYKHHAVSRIAFEM